MHLPTTRYGRFLVYRERNRKRRERFRNHKRRASDWGEHLNAREREEPPFEVQAEKSYPKIIGTQKNVSPFIYYTYKKAGGTGRPPAWSIVHPSGWWGFTNHPRGAQLRAVVRRRRKWPKFSALPLVGYAGPRSAHPRGWADWYSARARPPDSGDP